MPIEAELLEFESAKDKLLLDQREADAISVTRAFIDGDHYQGGDQWVGPQPDLTNEDAMEVYAKLQVGFTSKDLLGQITRRARNACIGQEPDYAFVPLVRRPKVEEIKTDKLTGVKTATGRMVNAPLSAAEQKIVDEMEEAAVQWWDRRSVLERLQEFTDKRLAYGRGALRHFVPSGKLKTRRNGTTVLPKVKTLQEALMKFVYLESPEPENARVVTDTDVMEEYGVTTFERGEDEIIELVFVDDAGMTFVETLDVEDSAVASEATVPSAVAEETTQIVTKRVRSFPMDLGGRLTLHESRGRPLISEQMRQNQKLADLGLTMMVHNVIDAGFSERTLLNANLPGTDVEDDTAPEGIRTIADPMPRGYGVVHNVVGLSYKDKDGNEHLAQPGVYDREPAPVSVFKEVIGEGTWNCLEEAQQLHALISGDASPSGESRIQALADFVVYCMGVKVYVDRAGRHTLETAIAMAAQFCNQSKKFAPYRVNFSCRIYVGRMAADERKQLLDELAKRVRSRRSVMVALDIADVDAELIAIDEDIQSAPPPVVPAQPNPNNPPGLPPTLPASKTVGKGAAKTAGKTPSKTAMKKAAK